MRKFTVMATAAALMLLSCGPALADQGGCPNDSSANGAAHANSHSAHGAAKQAERGCVQTPPPPPPCDPATDPSCGVTG